MSSSPVQFAALAQGKPATTGAGGFQARGLTKRYGAFLALDHVDFQIRPGEILGYLGPNGSGKSTTVNTVVGLIEPSAGSLWLDGTRMLEDPVAYKRRIGYVPEEPHLYTHMTAIEYLMLVGRLRGLSEPVLAEKVPAFLQLLSLWESRYSTMAAYSKGMRQRVLLASALLHNPDLLVLDEPFSGLDVPAGLLFRTLLRLFASDDGMVLFSTHRFDMVEQLCSRVVILSAGRIVAERDLASLRDPQSPSLEDVFVRSTGQDDFTPLARQILALVRA
jgi:ABC-2 type transport system ATP-binding protein